ncbi:alpha/beta fold hydrolase [Marinobacter fonticola]|uniref:alpha/beta fold hydrolase n=1 Tax=Marinobacter fonticola TaxID=2603215 RepID=UPI00143CD826|nr:alpha/beta hydrolase [Marinobacter fonticola]
MKIKRLGNSIRSSIVGSLSAVMPAYFGSIGAKVFLTPRRNTSTQHWKTAYDKATRREVEVEGHRVPFWIQGCGPLVLLVHGWERDHFAMGGFVRPLLDGGYTVAAVDLPAHGEADGARAPLPLLAKAITEVVSTLDQPCNIIAHSIGGAMTVLAMEAHGLKPDRVVLISTPRSAEDYAIAQGKHQGLGRRALLNMVEQISRGLGEPLERFRVDNALLTLKAPVLLIHAEDDAIVSLQDAIENAKAGTTQTFWIPTGGHNRILGNETVIENAVQWLVSPIPRQVIPTPDFALSSH